jgi:FkbM family methyltransferase
MTMREVQTKPLIKAAFLTKHGEPWERQFPEGRPVIDGVQFFTPLNSADIVFVYDALPTRKLTLRTDQICMFVASEPETVKRYHQDFLAQFDAIITSDRQTPHPCRIFSHAGLPWHVGSRADDSVLLETPMSFEEIDGHFPIKKKLASVVSSNKAFTAEHRARLDFVAKLKAAFGDQIDVFGRGIADFADKRDVLDDYRYHIALENCAIDDYWTEKLADPFLTLTFPIYHGCPNILDYFPPGSLRQINIYEPEAAIATIKEILESDLAEESLVHLLEARRRVMREHNLFWLLSRTARNFCAESRLPFKERERLVRQETDFFPIQELVKYHIKRFVVSKPRLRAYILRLLAVLAKLDLENRWRYVTDSFFRSHQKWITENPEEAIRYNYDIPYGAHILDVGGYRGDFAEKFLTQTGANVTVCEPVPHFASQIRERFAHDPRVQVHEFGLSNKEEQVEFDLAGDASGVFSAAEGKRISVLLRDANEFLRETGVSRWDLVKLNIEGGEYGLLEHLIETGAIRKMRHLQVQFHLYVPDAKEKYKRIVHQLRRTHELQWRYPFVWESWKLREDGGKPG